MTETSLRGKGTWLLLGRRTAAYVTDIVLLFAVLAPLSFGVQWLLQISPASGPAIWTATILSFSLPSWLYFTLCDAGARGATLGKRLWRLRVTDAQGRRLSLPRAFGRTAIKLVPWEVTHLIFVFMSGGSFGPIQTALLVTANILLVVYYALAVVTRGRQSVHDLVVGTVVQGRDENI